MKRRIALTGIKPTGTPHIGNLLGAIRPGLELANDPNTTALYFIADYHALTTVHDGDLLRRMTYDIAATWLAFGLDPQKTVLYRQSDIPEVFELNWILACMSSKGWMNKAHAYKALLDKNRDANPSEPDAGINVGLYTYPILMAADILLFGTDVVPVGKDQVQHVELARDMAQRLNHLYGEVLTLPTAVVAENVAVVPGLDGKKMSKSYDNVIPLFLPANKLRKLINRIPTDSTPPEVPKDPESSHIFQMYRALASEADVAALAARYQSGISWGDAKAELFRVVDAELEGARARYDALMANPAELEAILQAGAVMARNMARPILERVRQAIGVARG